MSPVSDSYLLDTCWRRWQLVPKKVSHSEWAGPCPVCGGKDRFRVFQHDGGYWCRKMEGTCTMKGWLDDDKQRDFKPDPNWKANQIKREQEEKDHRSALVKLWQASYRVDYWKGWHANLTDKHRAYFINRGIPDDFIDNYGLGYCAEKHIEDGSILPAYTIPVRSPKDWQVVNIHFRLIGRDKDKYRGEHLKDQTLPAAAFYCEKHGEHDKVIVVEGAFKAMVVYQTLGRRVQVVGLPSATPSEFIIQDIFENYRTRTIWLDPGAEAAVMRIATLMNFEARIVTTAWKPDDAILEHGNGYASAEAWIRQGVKAVPPKETDRQRTRSTRYVSPF